MKYLGALSLPDVIHFPAQFSFGHLHDIVNEHSCKKKLSKTRVVCQKTYAQTPYQYGFGIVLKFNLSVVFISIKQLVKFGAPKLSHTNFLQDSELSNTLWHILLEESKVNFDIIWGFTFPCYPPPPPQTIIGIIGGKSRTINVLLLCDTLYCRKS